MANTHQRPGHVICKLAQEKKADSITVGQRGLGTVSRALVGSTSDYILHHSDVPVMVVPADQNKWSTHGEFFRKTNPKQLHFSN